MKDMLIVTKRELREILKDCKNTPMRETSQFTIDIEKKITYWHLV